MLRQVARTGYRTARDMVGFGYFPTRYNRFRWSHTVEDYYPIAPVPRWQAGTAPFERVYGIIDQGRADYDRFLDEMNTHRDLIHAVAFDTNDDDAPRWNNGMFTALDAAALMTFLVSRKPKRYMEIGSGNSTKFARYAIDRAKLSTTMTSIDPVPRAQIDRLCTKVIRAPLETCNMTLFDALEAGDILFFDGSHRSFTNSDVTVFFFEVLPKLKPGVIVHIHDIFLPADYPEEWNARLYNEQYLLAAMFLCPKLPFKVLLPNAFIAADRQLSAHVEDIFRPNGQHRTTIPFHNHPIGRPGTSFWMQIV
jgi:hypothetical protein